MSVVYDLLKWRIENITVTHPPLLKIYYWESFDIDSFNANLAAGQIAIDHTMRIPVTQIYSKPLKVVFWLRNCSPESLELSLKRVKNCDCQPEQTRIGFNQFRQLYHCPHRQLIQITQEYIHMEGHDLVALTVTASFLLFGEHKLTYEMSCSDSRIVLLHFLFDVIGFDPQKCILTKELIPVDIREQKRFVQPIWVCNITSQYINFVFSSREHGFKMINPNLTVPRQSVWPLLVEYRANDFVNELELHLNFGTCRSKFHVKVRGVLNNNLADVDVPNVDYECVDFPYVIYPNRLNFVMELREIRSLMVSVHNYNRKCFEFRWQNYIINDLIEITFEPNIFRLKPHHSKLCVVNLRVHDLALNFRRIPVVLEVHRIFDKATKIAKELLEEVESIDDPKWKEESYMEHVFLHLNIKVNMKKEDVPKLDFDPQKPLRNESVVSTAYHQKSTTIMEKLFWDYLSKSNYMRENKDPVISELLDYKTVINLCLNPPPEPRVPKIDQNGLLRILSQIIAEGLRDLSKNWIFIPPELCPV